MECDKLLNGVSDYINLFLNQRLTGSSNHFSVTYARAIFTKNSVTATYHVSPKVLNVFGKPSHA